MSVSQIIVRAKDFAICIDERCVEMLTRLHACLSDAVQNVLDGLCTTYLGRVGNSLC